MTKKRMGKGLSALIPDDFEIEQLEAKQPQTDGENGVLQLDIKTIKAAENQARTVFDDKKLEELTASVREHGVIQPLLVRKNGKKYELVAGERRLRAAKAAGLKEVPAILTDVSDGTAAELGLIENIQREDLNALEEAVAFRDMIDEYGYTQETLAATLGKSRSYIANTLRLLSLSEDIKQHLMKGDLSAGHGRALLTVKAEPRREQLLQRILKERLSVRQAEEAAKTLNEMKPQKEKKAKTQRKATNAFYTEMENKLRDRFQTKIKIVDGQNGGRIEFSYHSGEELERLLELMVTPEE